MAINSRKLEKEVAKRKIAEEKLKAKEMQIKKERKEERIQIYTSMMEEHIDKEMIKNGDKIIQDNELRISRRYFEKVIKNVDVCILSESYKSYSNFYEEFEMSIRNIKSIYQKAGWVVLEDENTEIISFKRIK